jgi:hypothetical protein
LDLWFLEIGVVDCKSLKYRFLKHPILSDFCQEDLSDYDADQMPQEIDFVDKCSFQIKIMVDFIL